MLSRRKLTATLLALATLSVAACGGGTSAPATQPANDDTGTGVRVSPQVLIKTSAGNIRVALDKDAAPATVKNFLQYVDSGHYDGTIFHRVIDNFMIQGGGFTQSYVRKPVEEPIRNEADNGLRNTAYTIAMARTIEPHSATAQFFINSVDNAFLDHTEPTANGWGYAVFGRVLDGQDVVDQISAVETTAAGPFASDVPVVPVVIESVSQAISAE
jgi:peptidyl-prolyl cis-trans isomerase B (cyclophilin B)